MHDINLSQYSFHFLVKPIKSKRLVFKIAWLLILFIFFTANVYYVILTIMDYLNFETITSIYEINESSTEFPTISFCVIKSNHNISILAFYFNNSDFKNEWENHFEIF